MSFDLIAIVFRTVNDKIYNAHIVPIHNIIYVYFSFMIKYVLKI